MKCDRAVRLVEKLADGEASASERVEAEEHLDTCEDCRSHYRFVRALDSASEDIDWPEPPEAYWQHFPSRVLARIDAESDDGQSFWRKLFAPPVLRFAAVAATLTVVVAVGFSVLRDDARQMEPQLSRPSIESKASKGEADEPRADVSSETKPLASTDAPVSRATSPAAEEAVAESEPASEPPVLMLQRAAPAPPERDDAVGRNAGASEGARVASPLARTPELENRMQRSVPEAPGEADRPAEAQALPFGSEARLASQTRVSKESPARARAAAAVDRCEEARAYLARYGDDGNESVEARYQVALCSIDDYRRAPSDETMAAAVRDVDAFLALESEGERADELRRRAAEMRR